MKKIFWFLILFLLLSSPFPSKASNLPSLPPTTTLAPVENFGNALPTYFFQGQGFDLVGQSFETAANNYDNSIFTLDYSWSQKPMSEMTWRPSQNLYNSSGELVDPSNVTLVMGQNDLTFTYFLYEPSSGDILSIGNSYETSISTVNGYGTDTFWGKVGDILSAFGPSSVKAPIAIFNENEMTSSELEQIYKNPTAAYGYGTDVTAPYFFYIPDVTNVHTYTTIYNGEAKIFVDDLGLTLMEYGQSPAWNGNDYYKFENVFQSGVWTFNGHTYTTMIPRQGRTWYEMSPFKWVNSDSVPRLGKGISPFIPTEGYDTPDTVNMDLFDDNKVHTNYIKNNLFDSTQPVTRDNSPFTAESNDPDVGPTYNYYIEYITYEGQPNIGDSTGNLTDSIVGDDLPVLRNLKERFPFSIPWDIKALVVGLSTEPEAPHLEGDIPFGPLNYVYHFDLDFSDFDDTAALFRKLFLITFVIGLAWFSYDHFFGS